MAREVKSSTFRIAGFDTRIALPVVLLAVALPLLTGGDPYPIHVVTLFLMYSILAMGLSVVVSYAGLLDLGYVAFFAVGAYAYAIFNVQIHLFGVSLPFEAAIPLGALLAALAGVVLGFPTLRVRGDYLALVTLGFGEMVRQILQNWTNVTNGPKGIPAVQPPHVLAFRAAEPWQYYLLVLACTGLAMMILRRITTSPVARIWEAIRDDERAARACGFNSPMWLLLAFGIGTSFAGVVGVLFAAIQRFVSPETFVLDESILILSIVVLSGGKSFPRIFLATGILFGLPELLRPVQQYRTLAFGLVLVVFTIADYKYGARALRRHKLAEASNRRTLARVRPRDVADALAGGHDGAYEEVRAGKEADGGDPAIVKSFPGLKNVLNGLSFRFTFDAGLVALIGPNGAGKTTFFNCVAGADQFGEGRVVISGRSFGRLADHSVAKCGVARTFQQVRVFRSMSVGENVELGAMCNERVPLLGSLFHSRSLALYRNSVDARVNAALRTMGILSLKEDPITALPIGLLRKTELARAIAMRPRLLLLDEVASGLNEAEKEELGELLRRLSAESGVSVWLVEHDMAFVRRFADQVVVLDEGKLLTQGEPDEVLADPRVVEAYLGPRYTVG